MMAEASNDTVKEMKSNITRKRSKAYRTLVGLWPWRKGRDNSKPTAPALSTASHPTTQAELALPSDHNNLGGNAILAKHDGVDAQNQESGTPVVDQSPPLRQFEYRDLWDEAWKSKDLSQESKERLEVPWKHPCDVIERWSGTPRGDKGAESGENSTEDGQRRGVKADESDSKDWVDDVIYVVKSRQKEYPDQWDTATKVVTSILATKDVVAAGLAFDPTGYGSCAWAVVSFGLTLIQNDRDRRDRAFEATGFLSELLAEYSYIEGQYRLVNSDDDGVEELKDAIVQVYVAILTYSAEVKGAADGTAYDRVASSFKALTDQPLVRLKETIREKDKTVKRWKRIVVERYESRFRKDTHETLQKIKDEAANIVGKLESMQKNTATTREKIEILSDQNDLDWLSPADNSSVHKHQVLRKTIQWKGTKNQEGHRFFQEKQYSEWKDHPQSVLWLFAPPGRGKSSLCCSIIDDLGKLCERSTQKHLVFWYFQPGQEEVRDLGPLVRSFLRQLCSAKSPQHGLREGIRKWILEKRNSSRPPDDADFVEKVANVIKELRLDIFLVLDGIDECPRQSKGRVHIIEVIRTFLKAASGNLHVLLVSKPENYIRNYLQADGLKDVVAEMDVKDVLKAELDDFIDTTIEGQAEFEPVRDEIRNRLKESEEGFLWAASMIHELENCGSDVERIKTQLKKVPQEMATKYAGILGKVEGDKRQATRLILMWLLWHKHAEKTLTQGEIAEASGLKSRGEDIGRLKISPLFMTFDQGDQQDRLIELEYSAKEYLQERQRQAGSGGDQTAGRAAERPWFCFSEREAHFEITRRCLKVLLDTDKGRPKKSQLKRYAAEHWHSHYRDLHINDSHLNTDIEQGMLSDLESQAMKLLKSKSSAFKSWLALYDPDKDFEPSEFDLKLVSDDDSSGTDDSNSEHENGSTESEAGNSGTDSNEISSSDNGSNFNSRKPRADPVYYAVKLDLTALAIKMIKSGASHARPGREGTVLQLALYNKYWDVANAILHSDCDLVAAVRVRDGPHGTPLYIASARAEDSEVTIVKTLIQKGARANGVADGKYGGALHVAAYTGRGAAVRLLLEEGEASVDQEGGTFGTALQAAAAKKEGKIVEMLLEQGANPTMVCGIFGTALQAALAHPDPDYHTLGLLQTAIGKKLGISCGLESADCSRLGWAPAVNRLKATNEQLFERYKSLFPIPSSNDKASPIPDANDLVGGQILLAGTLETWSLPDALYLRRIRNRLTRRYLYYVPVKEQLEDLERVLPDFQSCSREHELNRRDFPSKALFWSGINYILKNFDPLVRAAVDSMEMAVMRGGDPAGDDDTESQWNLLSERERDLVNHGNSLRFRWLYGYRDVDMDLSDKLVLDVARQQRLLSQKQASREGQGSHNTMKTSAEAQSRMKLDRMTRQTRLRWIADEAGTVDNGDDNDDGETDIHLVVDSLLPLTGQIVEFGKQCDQLHETASRLDKHDKSEIAVEAIADLSFELLAAVVRLSVSMEQWRRHRSSSRRRRRNSMDTDSITASLAQTVHLLQTVRLTRITKLATVASQHLPEVVREEEATLLDRSQDQMFEQMRDLVRDAVRSEMDHQQNRGWGKYFSGSL